MLVSFRFDDERLSRTRVTKLDKSIILKLHVKTVSQPRCPTTLPVSRKSIIST